MSSYFELSRREIALTQLETAIRLYLENDDLISAITLAGASEELLGKELGAQGKQHSLDDTLQTLCGMYEAAFGKPGDPKAFRGLRNRARDAFKHRQDAADITVNLEREAAQMIGRAVDNCRRLQLPQSESFGRFQSVRLERARHIEPTT